MARLLSFLVVIFTLPAVVALSSWPAVPAPPAAVPYPNEQGKEAPKLPPQPKSRTDLYGDPIPPEALVRMGTVRGRTGIGGGDCLAFSPDGKMIATGPINNGFIRLWDTASRRAIRRLEGRASILCFSADGRTLYSYSFGDDAVRSWDVASGKPLHTVKVPTSQKATFHLSLKAVIIPFENFSWNVSVLDMATGQPFPLPAEWLASRNLAFSPAGGQVAVLGRDHHIRLFDRAGGKLRHELGELQKAFALVFSPDGKRLAAGVWESESAVIQVWDTKTGKSVSRCVGHLVGVQSLAFSADGNSLASEGRDMVLRLWDVGTGKERWRFNTPGACAFMNFAFSPDGKTLGVAGRDGVLYLLDAITGKEHYPAGEPVDESALAFTPDGKTLISGGGLTGSLRLWEMATGKEIRSLRGPRLYSYSNKLKQVQYDGVQISTVACSPDGKTLAVGSTVGIEFWDWMALKEPRYLKTEHYSCGYSPDGKYLATWGTSLILWDAAGTKKFWAIPSEGGINSVCFSPDGRLLASALGLEIRLQDVASGKEVLKFTAKGGVGQHNVWKLVFSPDGKTLATATHTDVSVWEVISKQKRLHFVAGHGGTNGMCFSPDGNFLVMGGTSDKEIRFHRVATGEVAHRLLGHDDSVMNLAFTPDGNKLVSVSSDLTMLVWNVGDALRKLRPQGMALTPQALEALWKQLAGADTRKAHQALWSLRLAPQQTVPFLRKILRPQDSPDLRLLPQLVAGLDSREFAIRDKATRELEELGWWVRPVLLEALAKSPPLETRRRIERLLKRTEDKSPTPEMLRMLRAVEILAAIGTPEGRQVLEKLAQGKGESLLEQEARASLRRLAK